MKYEMSLYQLGIKFNHSVQYNIEKSPTPSPFTEMEVASGGYLLSCEVATRFQYILKK